LLGCATCYAQFEAQLGPLLARAHEGGTHHVGKSPRPVEGAPARPAAQATAVLAPAAPQPRPAAPPKINPQVVARAIADRIAMLKKKLAEAVAAEQYEKAAKIRDELLRLEGPSVGAPAPTTGATAKRKPRSSGDRGTGTPGDGGGEGTS
jgi:protein arginine kinase activator